MIRYQAALLTNAARPVPLTIGRASSRRGLRRLSAWWVRTFRSWELPPLSTVQMLALQAVRHDWVAYRRTLCGFLRQALPRRWWHAITGDPVALILGLPQELSERVLRVLVEAPGTSRDVSKELDPMQIMAEQQRRLARGGRQHETQLTLAMAAASVRQVYGETWFFDPARWPTTDGYVPFALALVEAEGVRALEARHKLVLVESAMIPTTKQPARAMRQLVREAFPPEAIQ